MMMTRRAVLGASAAATTAAMLPMSGLPALAGAPPVGKQAPGFFRFKIGDFEITALHDGIVPRQVQQAYIPNTPLEEVQKVMAAQFMATDVTPNHFTVMTVNTGSKLILIDSGFNNNGAPTTGQLAANMAAAGIDPRQIDTVLVSHFHPDHINGLRAKEGAAVYPNAELVVPAKEWAFWMDDARMNNAPEAARPAFGVTRRVFAPVAKDVRQFEWGKEVAPGITAIQSDGHTMGHTSFVVSSGTKSLLVVGDACNDPRLFARNPEWHLMFDADKPLAVTSRKKLLDMASADRMQISFYHAAFPSTGFVAKSGAAYDWFPASFTSVL
ncbi:MAG TPA: MBL fold metallo-hydrolase [Beijerinckiaceae bacterium]|nr:MBL fold metallo-hydrolase [Beijerinckiaceae bacterium]